jgi:excisionase family DNA binding protein
MLLDTKEAAKVIGVSSSLLKRWRQDGCNLKFVMVGPRLIRYSTDDIEAYIKSLPRFQNNGEAQD